MASMLSRLKNTWAMHQLKDADFEFLFAAPPDEDWICFDCETTGLDPKKDKIVSLSAIKIRGNQILTSQALNLKFKQALPINPESIVIHGLRNMDVESGMDEREAIAKFLAFIGSRPLVGYFLEFDVAMVNSVIRPWLGISLPNPQLDISTPYSELFYKPLLHNEHEVFDLSFHAILEKCELPKLAAHDAFNDALMTAMIYVKLKSLKKAKTS